MTVEEEYKKGNPSSEFFKKYAIAECTFASLPRTTRGLPVMLSASPDGTKFLYCSGNSVFIRDANVRVHRLLENNQNSQNIGDCEVYTEHATLTQVAKYSPSGYYIASGDQSGKIRIWDTTQSVCSTS
jgi:WD40 repeat protein